MATSSPPLADEVLTKPELAKRLQLSTRTIDQWMRLRRLPYLKLGKTVRFRWSDVVAHLVEHRIN
jgi:excisionase family DNA binding protein